MSIVYRISSYNRRRKWKIFLREIAPTDNMRVLDVGFCEREYSETDNFIEKYYPYPEMLTALGINLPNEFKRRYPKVKTINYNGHVFPFKDKEFDVCWSNAVIEHVGKAEKQLFFLKEIKRVSKTVFLTTPNRFFPIEVHTRTPLLHYLPKEIFNRYLMWAGQQWATGDYMNLLSLADLTHLLDKADITEYKIFKNRLLGFTLDFVIIF